jgi:hypothetical protein
MYFNAIDSHLTTILLCEFFWQAHSGFLCTSILNFSHPKCPVPHLLSPGGFHNFGCGILPEVIWTPPFLHMKKSMKSSTFRAHSDMAGERSCLRYGFDLVIQLFCCDGGFQALET